MKIFGRICINKHVMVHIKYIYISNKYKLAREGEKGKEEDEDIEKGK